MAGILARFNGSSDGSPGIKNGILRHRWLLLIAGFFLCAGSAIGANAWLKNNARLWVVNGLPQGMLLLIDDQEIVFIGEQGYRDITLAEGRHRVTLVEPKWSGRAENEDFELRHSLQERFCPWLRPQHVLAPGRTAALEVKRERQAGPGEVVQVVSQSFSVGRFYSIFRDIDLPFLDFPVREKGDALLGPVEKTSLSVSRDQTSQFLTAEFAATQTVPDGVLNYAETQLLGAPSQAAVLYQYIRLAQQLNQGERAMTFVGSQLSKRPLWHEWHRAYQTTAERLGRRDELLREYDAHIAKESQTPGPAYSGMLYLRGRLERDDEQMLKYMRQAVEAHPDNYYAWYADGFTRLAQGKLSEAEEGIRQAFQLRMGHADYRNRYLGLSLGLGRSAAIQRMLNREFNGSQSADLNDQEWLLDAILLGGNLKAVDAAQKRFSQLTNASDPGDPSKLVLRSQLHWLYLQAKFAEIVDQSRELGEHPLRHQALLELGRLQEVPTNSVLVKADPYSLTQHLLLSAAWRQQGSLDRAEVELNETLKILKQGVPDEQLLATLLMQPEKATLSQVTQITIDPLRKALALLVLVQKGAQDRKELLDLAGKLNYSRHFPYHFVSRTVASLQDEKKKGS